MPNFGDKIKDTLAFKSFAGEMPTTSTINHIPLNQICVRFQNKYINNIDKHTALKNSIKANGLIEPIIVIEIKSYLDSELAEDEKEYLCSMANKGCKYFISSGHRRFKAYASIAMDKDYYTDSDLDELYTNLFEEKYKDWKERPLDLNNLYQDNETSWFEIPAKIISDENEGAIYNDSNTTQREITAFEIIDNAIDEMVNNGTWEKMVMRVKIARIESMTDRAVRDNIKNLVSNSIIAEPLSKKIGDLRNILCGVDSEYIPGMDGPINKEIVEYIRDNKQREVSESSVNYTRKILSKFSKEMVKTIYDGHLNFKQAKAILPIYDDLDINEAIKEIREGKFSLNQAKPKYNKIKFTERQLIDFIYDIKNGKITAEEVIKMLEQK